MTDRGSTGTGSSAGTVLEAGHPWTNWARNEQCLPEYIARPTSLEDVQEVVRVARERGLTVKPIGAGHSFTPIGVTSGVRLDTSGLTGIRSVDGPSVTLGAGTPLHALPELLGPYGLALENMGDIDRQTIAGATSTGTHGTGSRFGGIAAQLSAVTLVTADARVLRVTRRDDPELFSAVALGLGALGVVVDVTVECVPQFLLHAVERPEPLEHVLSSWMRRLADHDHFEFYWFPHTRVALTKVNTRLDAGSERHPLSRPRRWFDDSLMSNSVYAATVELCRRAPAAIPPVNRLAARLTGDREFTDLSHRVFVTDRRVRFREMEYAIPVEEIPAVVREINALVARRDWKISFPIEVRAAAPDDLMLSTASGRASGYVAVHRYWREDPDEYFRAVEEIFISVGGRPHWGKMHTRTATDLAQLYPRFADFVAVRDRLDPDRVFANPYLEKVLGA